MEDEELDQISRVVNSHLTGFVRLSKNLEDMPQEARLKEPVNSLVKETVFVIMY